MEIPTLDEVEQELARRYLSDYVEYTNKTYIHGKFTRFLTKQIQDFIEADTGNAYDILLLSVAPQHGKSETVTRTLPAYLLGRFPEEQSMLIAYESTFAEEFLEHNKTKIVDHNIFNLNIVRKVSDKIETDKGGAIRAMGFKSGITGRTAKYVIIDDPIKNQEQADSEVIRSKIWKEFNSSVRSRLKPGAKVIVIMTRWHKQDLAGMIMDNEPNVKVLNFPVECEEETDVMGRNFGDMLCPEMGRDRKWWDSFKQGFLNTEGSRSLNALYYGRPNNAEGGLFKKDWFQYYETLPRIMHMAISVDATFKKSANSDFVAIQVWGKSNNDYYLIDKVKERMTFIETIAKIRQMADTYSEYDEILIEDKANGSAIIDVLNKRYNCVIAINPKESKEARASAVSPMVESRHVFIKKEHYSLVQEAIDFPNSDHDDEVDCMDQALNRLRNVYAEIPKHEVVDTYDEEMNEVIGLW